MNTSSSESSPSSVAFGVFLVGLVARVVAVSARVLPAGSGLMLEQFPDVAASRRSSRTPGAFDAWARETRLRVRSTLSALGIEPDFSVSFDPLPARGAALDLAILAACLGAAGRLGADVLGSTLFLAELSIEGRVRPVRGVLPALRGAGIDRAPPRPWTPGDGDWRAVVSRENRAEATRAGLKHVFAIERAADLVDDKGWPEELVAEPRAPLYKGERLLAPMGGLSARVLRALAIAAAGEHGVLLVGPERLRARAARALHALLPPMGETEAREATEIHSISGLVADRECGRSAGLLFARPFRAPHHTCSTDGLIGGGDPPRPGEASLARHGVLFMDAAPEFKREALDRLARVLNEGEAVFVRRDERVVFPTEPLLVLGAAPCKCEENRRAGALPADAHERWCSREQVAAYHARALGPERRLARRVDVAIEIDPNEPDAEPGLFDELLEKVARAWDFSTTRGIGDLSNGRMKAVRVARTIADLDGSYNVLPRHREEAVSLVLAEP